MRTRRRASELTHRPPTITGPIDQLGEPVDAHRSLRPGARRRPRHSSSPFLPPSAPRPPPRGPASINSRIGCRCRMPATLRNRRFRRLTCLAILAMRQHRRLTFLPNTSGDGNFLLPSGLDSNFHAPSSLLAARYRGMLMKFKSSRVSLSSRISIFENHRSFVENGRPGLLLSAFSSVSRRLEVMGKSERSYPCAG